MLVIATGTGYLPFIPTPAPISHQLQQEKKTVASLQIVQKPVTPIITAKPPERKIYSSLGSASSASVTTAVEFFQYKGLTNEGVAYLVGNFAAESGLRPDAIGDGGLALGIAQWHPERRVGLPDTLEGQLSWAWSEIQHYPLASAVYGSNVWLIQNGIKGYEGYGVEGNRFEYARELLKELQ